MKKNSTIYFLLLLSIVFSLNQHNSAQQKPMADASLVVDSFSPIKDSLITLGVLINLQEYFEGF